MKEKLLAKPSSCVLAASGAVARTASELLVSRKDIVPVGEDDPENEMPPETLAFRVHSSPFVTVAEMLVTVVNGPVTASEDALDELRA